MLDFWSFILKTARVTTLSLFTKSIIRDPFLKAVIENVSRFDEQNAQIDMLTWYVITIRINKKRKNESFPRDQSKIIINDDYEGRTEDQQRNDASFEKY